MRLCILLLAAVFATVYSQEICCQPEVYEIELGKTIFNLWFISYYTVNSLFRWNKLCFHSSSNAILGLLLSIIFFT